MTEAGQESAAGGHSAQLLRLIFGGEFNLDTCEFRDPAGLARERS